VGLARLRHSASDLPDALTAAAERLLKSTSGSLPPCTTARAFPGKKPVEILSLVTSNRQGVVDLANAKSKQAAPVFVAWFGWQPPMFDGRMRAFHCIDICFWFYNTDLMFSHTGGGARPRKLATLMAGQLLQFMKTGQPNGKGLPTWPKYTPANGEVMILDDVCEVKNDPDREARQALPTP
jgi:para-nitrobenzyl esterase